MNLNIETQIWNLDRRLALTENFLISSLQPFAR